MRRADRRSSTAAAVRAGRGVDARHVHAASRVAGPAPAHGGVRRGAARDHDASWWRVTRGSGSTPPPATIYSYAGRVLARGGCVGVGRRRPASPARPGVRPRQDGPFEPAGRYCWSCAILVNIDHHAARAPGSTGSATEGASGAAALRRAEPRRTGGSRRPSPRTPACTGSCWPRPARPGSSTSGSGWPGRSTTRSRRA